MLCTVHVYPVRIPRVPGGTTITYCGPLADSQNGTPLAGPPADAVPGFQPCGYSLVLDPAYRTATIARRDGFPGDIVSSLVGLQAQIRRAFSLAEGRARTRRVRTLFSSRNLAAAPSSFTHEGDGEGSSPPVITAGGRSSFVLCILDTWFPETTEGAARLHSLLRMAVQQRLFLGRWGK